MKNKIKTLLDRLKQDERFNSTLFLTISLIWNWAYAVFLLIVSKIEASNWFFVMAIYYAFLFLIRFFVLQNILYAKKSTSVQSEIKVFRLCGIFLLFINVAVSTMAFIMIYTNPPVRYHEITVIAIATYTFTSLTVAIVSCVRFLKRTAYAYSALKFISLISASVSMLTLTNTMLATFGADNALLRSIILPLLGVAVSVLIIATAIFMIYKANLGLKECKDEKDRK